MLKKKFLCQLRRGRGGGLFFGFSLMLGKLKGKYRVKKERELLGQEKGAGERRTLLTNSAVENLINTLYSSIGLARCLSSIPF